MKRLTKTFSREKETRMWTFLWVLWENFPQYADGEISRKSNAFIVHSTRLEKNLNLWNRELILNYDLRKTFLQFKTTKRRTDNFIYPVLYNIPSNCIIYNQAVINWSILNSTSLPFIIISLVFMQHHAHNDTSITINQRLLLWSI